MDLDSGEKDYLIATAETCKCGEILHHAVGIETWCPDRKCPHSSLYVSPEQEKLQRERAAETMRRAQATFGGMSKSFR